MIIYRQQNRLLLKFLKIIFKKKKRIFSNKLIIFRIFDKILKKNILDYINKSNLFI